MVHNLFLQRDGICRNDYRFTMIKYLQDDYRDAFEKADHVVITELYTAGEVPIPGIDTEFLCAKIREGGAEVVCGGLGAYRSAPAREEGERREGKDSPHHSWGGAAGCRSAARDGSVSASTAHASIREPK